MELDGFQSRAALGRCVDAAVFDLPRRNGDGFAPPMRAVRKLHRVGLLTRTWGSGEREVGIGAG